MFTVVFFTYLRIALDARMSDDTNALRRVNSLILIDKKIKTESRLNKIKLSESKAPKSYFKLSISRKDDPNYKYDSHAIEPCIHHLHQRS